MYHSKPTLFLIVTVIVGVNCVPLKFQEKNFGEVNPWSNSVYSSASKSDFTLPTRRPLADDVFIQSFKDPETFEQNKDETQGRNLHRNFEVFEEVEVPRTPPPFAPDLDRSDDQLGLTLLGQLHQSSILW